MTEKERYDWDLNGIWDYNDESDEYIESYEDITKLLNEQEETIQSLKKELFESEKDYIMETYSDNPIRRDEKIQSLKEEFKARFGDVE